MLSTVHPHHHQSSSSSSSSSSSPIAMLSTVHPDLLLLDLRANLLSTFLANPMIQRTYERAKLASMLDQVVVVTYDNKITECCRELGTDVIMTSESCRNGAERRSEALQKLNKKYDIVVNIQGDEPLIEPEKKDGIFKALQFAPDAIFSTAVTSLKFGVAFDPNRVTCVVDKLGYAIYFS